MTTAPSHQNTRFKIQAALAVFLLTATGAQAASEGDLVVRGSIISVLPQSESVDPTNELMPILSNTTSVAASADYYLSPNISTELSLPISTHNVKSNQDGSNMGSVWMVAPSLTLKYHFFTDKLIQPYVGAGVNYAHFFATDSANGRSLDFTSAFAPVLQIGADMQINKNWSLNADVKRMFIRPEVGYNNLPDKKDTIDPYILGFGVGYKF